MGVAVLLILVGAALIVLGAMVAIAGVIVEGKRKRGAEAEPASPDIWTKIVDWLLKKLDFLIDKVLKGSVTALGLILVILGAVSILGGALVAGNDDGDDDPPATTTTTSAAVTGERTTPS